MIKAIIFDFDGVIANTEPFHIRAWAKVLKSHGVNPDEEFYRTAKRAIGTTDAKFLTNLLNHYGIKGNIEEWFLEKRRIYWEMIEDGVESFPGVKEFIHRLYGKFPLAIASSARRGSISRLLKKFSLTEYFPVIVAREDVAHHKPHPKIYLTTASRLYQFPRNCLVFEDSLVGVQAAKRAGMKCVGVAHSFSPEELREADLIIEGFDNLEGIEKLLSQKVNNGAF